MKLFPKIYLRQKGDRLQVASTGKLNNDLSTWGIVTNLTEKVKDSTDNETQKMADGTEMTTAEKINYEFAGLQMNKTDFDTVKTAIKSPIDLCLYDEKTRQYLALYTCRCSVKKTAESGNSVTFTFTAEKRCTDAETVSEIKSLKEAYITGIVIDGETGQPVVGATITCTNPAKSGYSVTTDSHGEFTIEVQINESASSIIHIVKGADVKDVTIPNLEIGSIIEDLEVSL